MIEDLHEASGATIFRAGTPKMKIALISDVHSNIQALEAVLDFVDDVGVDKIVCLGDIVGYGADPKACLDILRLRCSVLVLGNHDLAVVSESNRHSLPRDGRKAAKHNHAALEKEDLEFLASLPYVASDEGCTFVHATPREPEHWYRLSSYQESQSQFSYFTTDICFNGHTHRPSIISDKLGVLQVRPGHRYLVNVGSVGQPRDGDPRASFGLFDTKEYSYRLVRVEYDIEGAIDRIKEEGLPKRLGLRLRQGL
jgi:diadenosine tetraphosphatase ApaH/serine/threonine PP2A family protein phosphatase